ncbi:ABC transporter substrate-binding protein [Enterovirga sp.]|jgi:putative ABC transport system substrate-binding protein|uniref:ABC transporter substrate-binding protein n=1 Tax=Enterovirga sp. TaxID=2026350 RepID=UPI00262EF5B7|nr:ABC transporter substrate-binding protein [Enterovirga sp.]MDB5592659.1 transporter substrate-binding protein [Enterovirga sp.]
MRRRELLAGPVAVGLSSRAWAQTRTGPIRIGFITFQGPALSSSTDELRKGLTERGYVDGRDVVIEAAFVDGDRARAERFVRDLVEQRVDVIVAWTTPAGFVAKRATEGTGIPVVLVTSDPVAAGLVASLARPGGNLTGISMASPDLSGKRLQLLKEVMPRLRTVAFLGNSRSANAPVFLRQNKVAADQLGLSVVSRLIDSPELIDEKLLDGMKQEGAEALVVQPNLTGQAARIVALATKAGMPVVSDHPPFAAAGALLTLGADERQHVRQAAYYIDRILKGSRPADLPIEQPTSFPFILNARAARQFGLALPPDILSRADEVID